MPTFSSLSAGRKRWRPYDGPADWDSAVLNAPQEAEERKFAHYLRRAGLSGFKLHSLRHSFATILVSRGVDLYTVSRLLGHADIRTSMIYAKARMDTLQEAVDRLELDSGKEHGGK